MDSTTTLETQAGAGIDYPTTGWTTVLEASGGDPERAAEALARLCENYRGVIVRYFTLAAKADPAGAEDLAHEFLNRLLSRGRLGTFRRFPNTPFRHYLARALARFRAGTETGEARPEGGQGTGSLDELLADRGFEPSSPPPDHARLIDEPIAAVVHRRALARVRDRCREGEQRARFEALEPFLLFESSPGARAEVARRLGLVPNALQQALFRLRNEYYDAFRSEVAETVGREDIDTEMRYLIQLLPDALGKEAAGSS